MAVVMSCALCLGIFAGCSGKYDLTVWIFCSANDADTNNTLVQAWAANYYEENKAMFEEMGKEEIKVKFDYDIDSAAYFELLQNKIAADDAEDIIYVSPKYIKAYAAAGTTLDLTPYVDWDGYDVSNIYGGAISSYAYNKAEKTVGMDVKYDAESKKFVESDGTAGDIGIYALPKDYSSFALAYNQNFFTNALKDAYTNKSGSDSLKPSGVYYVDSDGGQGAAADSYITIGRTIRYYPFNFYRFNTYEDALKGNDPVAKLAEMNGGYDVTIMGWPGDTYDTGLEDNPATAYDESIGYVVYSYAEYSAMTYAICYFAQIADRNAKGQHTLMTWLNDDYYGSNNYVYGNDQYEGTLYLTAWLLGNDVSIINDTYTSVDASYDYVLNSAGTAYEKQNNTDVKKSTKFGDDLNVYDSDYGVNSEKYIEAYAAFLAYGSDWNGNSYFAGNPNESESTRGGWGCFSQGRCVFYGLGTWDFQSLNSTSTKYLNLGIMPEPVSEDYAVFSRIKNAAYKSETYGTDEVTTEAYNMYDESTWTIDESKTGFANWSANENARQNEWFARMDTVGYGVNGSLAKEVTGTDDEWKIEAAADLCAWMTIGEDIQVALTYSGAQFSSRADQADDYIAYQTLGDDGAFNAMLTPEGNAANSLTVTAAEVAKANTYLTDTLGITLSGTTLTGNDIWQFAVAAANLFYLEGSGTVEEWINTNFPALKPYLNQYFKGLSKIEGVAMSYKALNMIPLDTASRNLQVRMPAVNGAADSCTYTYSGTWYDTPFGDNKGKALITYNINKAPGAFSILNKDAVSFDLSKLADIKEGGADGKNWSGTYYTPLAFSLTLVESVSSVLLNQSLNAELAATK